MSTKWLTREGERWVEEEIVTREQLERIRALYGKKERSVGLLPIFGGLLLGLGVLSFVAANWQALPNEFRIALLLAVMLGFYGTGWRSKERGNPHLGTALIGVGLFAFGGSLILVGQMFHMVAYSAFTLVIWSAAGAALTYILHSRYLFMVTLALSTIAQIYSLSTFETFSFPAFAVLTLGLVWFVRGRRSALLTALWSLGIVVHSLLLVLSYELKFGWFFVPLLLLYAAGDLLLSGRERTALQTPPLAAAFVFGLVMVFFDWDHRAHWGSELQVDPAVFLPVALALLLLSGYAKYRRGDVGTLTDWLLFVPLLYAPSHMLALLYLAVLFLFSVITLLQGYSDESGARINVGMLLFLLTTMTAYFKLTWAFMDKSVFFLIGGSLLLALSWLLNRRKRQVLLQHKEE
jgi:uncharacterized membrane protein